MAEFLKKIPTNLTEYPNSFRRQGAFPLEAYSVFYTKAEADTYAASNPLAYVGQTIAVALSNTVTLYVIDQNSKLKEVGSVPVGDGQSIEVVDGKIQVKGFAKGYYKYNAEIDTHYEYVEGEFISGLEPRVIAVANGKYEIAWYEPNPTTVEGLESQISSLSGTVGGLNSRVSEAEELLADHDTRIIHLEGNNQNVIGAVKTVEPVDGEYILKDSKGNEVGRIPIAEAVTNFAYHAEYTDKDGKTYDNVLVLELSNGEEQIIEIEDLIKIYKEEENATEVQITITKSTGPTDPNNPASDEPNIISAKLTDSVKEAINKGVEAHEGLSHSQSDVQLNYSEELGEHRVLLKDSVRENINKGVTAYNTLFDGTTTFVLNGGNASGYVVATDESTEV